MSAEKDSCCVRLPEIVRTRAFHWNTFRGKFGRVGPVRTMCHPDNRLHLLADFQISDLEHRSADHRPRQYRSPAFLRSSGFKHVQQHLSEDPRRVKLVGLFELARQRIIGNIESLPRDLMLDAPAQELSVVRIDAVGREQQTARTVARKLDDGQTLLVGRNTDELTEMGHTIERAVTWGLIPALCLGSLFGAFLSIRTQQRLDQATSGFSAL